MSMTSESYLERAAECARDAQSATLDNVRERNLRSEAAWRAMAARLILTEKATLERSAKNRANMAGDEPLEECVVS